MTDVSDATAAPSVVTLRGRQYYLPPLTEEDWGKFERWLRDRENRVAAENSESAANEEQRLLILERGADRASEIHINHPSALKIMASFEGATQLLWINLQKRHPNIKLKEVQELCQDPAAMGQAYDILMALNFDKGKDQGTKSQSPTMSEST